MKLCFWWFSSLTWSSFLSRGLSSKICSKSLSRLILSIDSLRSVRLTDWSSWKLRFSLMTSASSWEELGLTFYCSSIIIFKLISVKNYNPYHWWKSLRAKSTPEDPSSVTLPSLSRHQNINRRSKIWQNISTPKRSGPRPRLKLCPKTFSWPHAYPPHILKNKVQQRKCW